MSATGVIGRVRVHGGVEDPVTGRTRLAALLAGTDLRPAGLPPNAILLIRRLEDPLPGRISLGGGVSRPPPAWERALSEALAAALAGAVRPADGPVPAGANALLFRDRAELLAYLGLQTAAPPGGWAAAALAQAGAVDVPAAWERWARHAPAAMQQLAERGAARSFARDLPVPVARRLVARIVAAWDARALLAAVEAPRTDALAAPPVRAASAVAPWRDLVPEATGRGLEEEQRLLLGVSLALARAPMVARGERFAAAVQRWRVAPGKAGGPLPVARSARPRSAARPMPAPAIDEPSIQASPESTDPPDPAASAPAVRSSAAPDHLAQLAAGRGNVQPPASPHAAPEGQPPHPPPRAPRRRRTRPPAATGTPRRLDPPTPQAEPPLARAVDTGYGGVFYLLNLALSLGLYGDFTRPLDRGLALGPWALLELLGPALLGRRDDDPLWPLLARLDGRPPGVPPGRSFRPPRAWRTPPEWLVPFEDVSGPWRWSAASGELRVRHPAGFLAIAVPLRADPAGQLRRELRRLRPDAVVRGGLPREPADPLRRWVGRLAAYAAARLNAAGCPPARVLPAHARVLVSPSHVDVVLDLAALPIEVRFAGLDRTPGWIPAAGRFVAFHFE